MKHCGCGIGALDFENWTRELKKLEWVPVSNHDNGYLELVADGDGAAHLGCWLTIISIASRCHLLLDEQGDQIFAMTDVIAERTRKIGGTTIRSIGDISRHQRLKDNDEEFVNPKEMLAELCADNQTLTRSLRAKHKICDDHNDVATTTGSPDNRP